MPKCRVVFIIMAALPVIAAVLMKPAFAETTYKVKSGDSLSAIAQRVGISLKDLVTSNNIQNINEIVVGQVLILPSNSKVTVTETTYTVKPGDTLSLIAKRFGVSLENLSADNKIHDANSVVVGQVLTIPTAAGISPQPLTGRALFQARDRLLAAQRQRTGQRIVANASKFAGTPYRWGGLTSRGMDCSGLVVRAMLTEGLRVPHRAAELYKMGKKVTYEELQSGDLVFFNMSGKGVSHVGIWIGDNKFIHASYSRGVVEDEMKGYFSKRLVGARRLR